MIAHSIFIDERGLSARHRFNPEKVGAGKSYKNISARSGCEMVIRITAADVDDSRTVSRSKGAINEEDLVTCARSVLENVKCLLDTGSDRTFFRGEIARTLALPKPTDDEVKNDGIEVFGGDVVPCCVCLRKLYLELGPDPIPVSVFFPVTRPAGGIAYDWVDGFPQQNVLGMKSVLNRRMLCITRDFLYAFKHL